MEEKELLQASIQQLADDIKKGREIACVSKQQLGTDLGISLLSKKTLRRLEMTLTSTAWLLPSKYFWHKDEVLMKAGNLTFTSANYTEFFNFINFPTGIEMRKRVQRFITEVQEPPGVSVHCLHGDGLHTVERLEYPTNEFKQANEPELILGDGDETVNRRSLEGCVFWYGKQSNSIQHHVFNKINHIKLLSDDDVLQYVAGVITAS